MDNIEKLTKTLASLKDRRSNLNAETKLINNQLDELLKEYEQLVNSLPDQLKKIAESKSGDKLSKAGEKYFDQLSSDIDDLIVKAQKIIDNIEDATTL